MQAIKTLVIVLGALIVVGVGLLGWGFYTKLKDGGSFVTSAPPAETTAPRSMPTPIAGLGEVRVPLPAGCTAVEMRPDGDRLFVRTGPTGLCERILILDTGTGRVVGTFVLAP